MSIISSENLLRGNCSISVVWKQEFLNVQFMSELSYILAIVKYTNFISIIVAVWQKVINILY